MTEPAPDRRYQITRPDGPYPAPGAQHVEAAPVTGRLHQYGMGRHVNHDPRSRRYRFTAPRRVDIPVHHQRRIPIFEQGDLGACTGMTGIGILGTDPYWSAFRALAGDGIDYLIPYVMDESGAVELYGEATRADPFEGEYPPDDTGSDGLSVAKVLTAAGVVPGYRHTFSLDEALQALAHRPLMVGTVWYDGMFYPTAKGVVSPVGAVVGGHEYIADEYVPAGAPMAATGAAAVTPMVGFTNSWGEAFGVGGRFYLTAADFGRLLDQDGDVIVLEMPGRPAPTPQDPPAPAPTADDADRLLMDAFTAWRKAKGLD